MRFLLDMGISPQVANFLRNAKHDALHLNDEGLGELDDPEILEKARSGGYVLLAHDLDFTDLLAASGEPLPSLVIFRLRDMRPQRVIDALQRVLATCQQSAEDGAIISVSESIIRVRPLPIKPAE
jgi:predicted nuclease of predicted toxin-antitoxin system